VRVQGGRRDVALDLRRRVRTGTEQGLLGIAFHPDFASNRLLYLHWTDRSGDTRVAELRAGTDRRTIRPRPVRELLHVRQPEENHNGGQLAFGPDGRLYLGLGDGGGAFDPRRTAQDPRSLLGKLLAADVDRGDPRWEVVLTGLRNPWRFSFDNALGEVWVADVGQDETEEINRVLLEPDEPPKNLGWSVFEGTRRLEGHRREGRGELVPPAATYTHADGCSVTGGVIYGGARLPRLSRRFVFGDFCSGTLWSLRAAPGEGATDVRREAARVPQLTHIGTDADGELVLASAAGALYRAVPAGS
jgi:glucose/arabinose dehydrogenase